MSSATYYPKNQNSGRTFLVPKYPAQTRVGNGPQIQTHPKFWFFGNPKPKTWGKNCSFVNWIHFRKLLNPLNGTRFFSIPNKPITTLKCVNGNYKSETDNISREKAVKYRSILPYS